MFSISYYLCGLSCHSYRDAEVEQEEPLLSECVAFSTSHVTVPEVFGTDMLQVVVSSTAVEIEIKSSSVCCSPLLGVWDLLSSEVQCRDAAVLLYRFG